MAVLCRFPDILHTVSFNIPLQSCCYSAKVEVLKLLLPFAG